MVRSKFGMSRIWALGVCEIASYTERFVIRAKLLEWYAAIGMLGSPGLVSLVVLIPGLVVSG